MEEQKEVTKMQVLISFTLNVKKPLSNMELESLLSDVCPMEVPKDLEDTFEVSTEQWNITGLRGGD